MGKARKVEDGQVVLMEYTLRVDGKIIDTSEGKAPFEFIQGKGDIIPGLERELYGMTVGESKDVVVSPKDGYGEVDNQAFLQVPRGRFSPDIPLEVGTQLQLSDSSGRPMHARIEQVSEENIRLDFNHPLAGKELHFTIRIACLRAATVEEKEHGHPHPGQAH